MKSSITRIVDWFRRSRSGVPVVNDVPVPRVEPLEPRLLLSGAVLGELPQLLYQADIGGDTYRINLPGRTYTKPTGEVTGFVFQDTDGDALRDPYEHALQDVTVYADVDGDRRLDPGEAMTATNAYGRFDLSDLPMGDYDIRAIVPQGHKPTAVGSGSASVSMSPSGGGIGGLSFAFSRVGLDLKVGLSDVSMPSSFETGTRVDVPVILSNSGDRAIPAGSAVLRVYVSSDRTQSPDDVRLSRTALKQGLESGESVKLNLTVNLPSSLADFTSYLIVDAVGKGLRGDLNPSDNRAIGRDPITFEGSAERPTIGVDNLNTVLGNWVTNTPYGGYTPGYGYGGDGFVGIDDLNSVLGNWNAGTPPPPPANPRISSVQAEGGHVTHGVDSWIRAFGVTPGGSDAIKQVMFFYDHNRDGAIDDVLGVDTDGPEIIDSSPVYSIDAQVSSSLPAAHSGYIVAVALDDDGNTGGARLEVTSRLGVKLVGGQELVFIDSEGKRVSVRHVGPGHTEVLLRGAGLASYDLGQVIEVTGHADLDDVRLEGTSGRSKLYVSATTRSGKSSRLEMLGPVTGSSPLGLLHAPRVDIPRGIQMSRGGVIRTLRVGAVHDITMPRAGYGNGVKISAESLTGRVRLGSHLRLLNAGDVSLETMTAPSAERILVRNDLSGRIELEDADAGLSLALLQVGGAIRDTSLMAASSIDTVRAGVVRGSHVVAGAWTDTRRLGSVPSHLIVKRSVIQHFQAGSLSSTQLSAWRLVNIDLENVQTRLSRNASELTYHRLVGYDGPRGIKRNVI